MSTPPWGKNVLVEFEEGIAWVLLNRPSKRNAMNPELNQEMLDVLDALELDDRCKVLILSGAGDSFSAGMDLKEFFRDNLNKSAIEWNRIRRINSDWQWRRLMAFPKPTIAMVNGWCFGGAFTPLISCDLSIAADEAKFGLSEINWGIIPAGNVTRALASRMTESDALYYIMTGEQFDGKKAALMRLVNESVPLTQLRQRTVELAKVLLGKNLNALRIAKLAFKRARSMDWETADDYLMAKSLEANATDPERGREKALSQFLDEKSFRPGMKNYRKD
jgi:trans-feruloyl-CoA hydratase/vanillin synthase